MLELLSPAATPEAVIAAVQSGADAIYIRIIGTGAENFTEDDFSRSVRYCRARGCRVYVDMDTLVSDEELSAAGALIKRASAQGADAIIVRDLGLIPVIRKIAPALAIHAGEKLGLHSLTGIKTAQQLGVSRVYLPREMSLAEIAALHKRCDMELGVTVQGRLCFSRAGLCYLCSLTDRQSDNRGDCSERCREAYSMGGRMDDWPMSLKDTRLVSSLEKLTAAGVVCARLGEDMRRPEQTAVVDRIYSSCISDHRRPSPGEADRLDLAFSDRDYTYGYLNGELGDDMFGVRGEIDRDCERMFADARKEYAESELRRVPVRFYAVVQKGSPVRIALEDDDGNKTTIKGARPRPAQGRAVTARDVEGELIKTGGTPFSVTSVRAMVDPGLELPETELAELRRAILYDLLEKRSSLPRRSGEPFPVTPSNKGSSALPPKMIFQVHSADQLSKELAALKPDLLYVPMETAASSWDKLKPFADNGAALVCVMPPIITDKETQDAAAALKLCASKGIRQALVGNLGHIILARLAGMEIRGDWGLNLYNSYALSLAEAAAFSSVTASFELRMDQIRDLMKPLPVEALVYGRLPAMVSDHCIIKRSAGKCACTLPARLANNKGGVFPVTKEFGCRNSVWGASKLFLADRAEDYNGAGLWAVRLLFTNESARECVEVAKSYLGQSLYRPNGVTRGLYYKGVD